MENSVITMFIFHGKKYSRLTLLRQWHGPKRVGAARLGGKEADPMRPQRGLQRVPWWTRRILHVALSGLCATGHKVSVARKCGLSSRLSSLGPHPASSAQWGQEGGGPLGTDHPRAESPLGCTVLHRPGKPVRFSENIHNVKPQAGFSICCKHSHMRAKIAHFDSLPAKVHS